MIVYASRTGNVEYIVGELGYPSVKIEQNLLINDKYILFTYTDGLGNVPPIVEDFLKDNHHLCLGVFASGNRNFGVNNFCGSANKINNHYGIPILHKMELRGTPTDFEILNEKYNELF